MDIAIKDLPAILCLSWFAIIKILINPLLFFSERKGIFCKDTEHLVCFKKNLIFALSF